MRTLCIPLIGPMQSWGSRSRFTDRDCERTPTKSGIVGILAAAMGLGRNVDLSPFRALVFAVRCEREGSLRREFQTALDVATADGKIDKNPQVSTRYYLADAVFVAAIGGDPDFIDEAYAALKAPVWQPFLGRRSYVPSLPPYDPAGPSEAENPRTALLSRPLIIGHDPDDSIRVEYDAAGRGTALRYDQPLSFEITRRNYAARPVRTEYAKASTFPRGTFFEEAKHVS